MSEIKLKSYYLFDFCPACGSRKIEKEPGIKNMFCDFRFDVYINCLSCKIKSSVEPYDKKNIPCNEDMGVSEEEYDGIVDDLHKYKKFGLPSDIYDGKEFILYGIKRNIYGKEAAIEFIEYINKTHVITKHEMTKSDYEAEAKNRKDTI